MNSSKIDFEFDDLDFILIAKSSITSLKSIIYNEIITIFKTLSVSNSILYFFFFSSTGFSIVYNEVVIIFKALSIISSILYFFSFSSTKSHYNLFSNSTDSLSFFSKLSFFSLFFLIFNRKVTFDFDLNFLTFEIELKISTFLLFLKNLIIIFKNIFYNVFKSFVK